MPSKGIVVFPNAPSRMGPWLGATRHPSLQRVANRPIVCHVLDALLEAGVLEVAVVAQSDAAEEIKACIADDATTGVDVDYLLDDDVHSEEVLPAAAEFVGDAACVVHRANGLLGQALSPYTALLEAEGIDGLLLLDDRATDTKRLKLVPNGPSAASEKRATAPVQGFAGVCVLAAGEFGRVVGNGRATDLPDLSGLIEKLRREGARTQIQPVRTWRQFAGDALDLLDLNRTLLDRLDDEPSGVPKNGNSFEGPVSIHPTAHVASSVIIGPALIGADAVIVDSYVGPHTAIAERVRIEGAELERSIVLADASLLHVGGRVEASVVGRHARIFRDFSMPRALRLHVGDGDAVALC